MPGLSNSRWADNIGRSSAIPSTTRFSTFTRTTTVSYSTNSPNESSQSSVSPASELMRYTKIVRRLKWKLPFLAAAYQQATTRLGPEADQSAADEAELMFKLDFFEYYMLCERALVHLQSVFGITISKNFAERHLGHSNGNNGASADHRYHANVLEALDSKDNPLHEVLGVGEARRQLARAKNLRNRWKNADEGSQERNGKIAAPLETYDLEMILTTIFSALDAAYVVAEQFVVEGRKTTAAVQDTDMELGSEEEQWEFMMDAMDWEAV